MKFWKCHQSKEEIPSHYISKCQASIVHEVNYNENQYPVYLRLVYYAVINLKVACEIKLYIVMISSFQCKPADLFQFAVFFHEAS